MYTLALEGLLDPGELAGDLTLGEGTAEGGPLAGAPPVVACCTSSSSFFFLLSSSLSVTLFSTDTLPAFRPKATRTAKAASLMSGAASFADLAAVGRTDACTLAAFALEAAPTKPSMSFSVSTLTLGFLCSRAVTRSSWTSTRVKQYLHMHIHKI